MVFVLFGPMLARFRESRMGSNPRLPGAADSQPRWPVGTRADGAGGTQYAFLNGNFGVMTSMIVQMSSAPLLVKIARA